MRVYGLIAVAVFLAVTLTGGAASAVTLKSGTYKMEWSTSMADTGISAVSVGLRLLSPDEAKQFSGLKSTQALISATSGRFIAIVDESGGTGKGYDTGYVIWRPKDKGKVRLSDAQVLPLHSEEGFLRSDKNEPALVNVELGGAGSGIEKPMIVGMAVDLSATTGGSRGRVEVIVRGEWQARIPTDEGEANIWLIDSNQNGIYGEHIAQPVDAPSARGIGDGIGIVYGGPNGAKTHVTRTFGDATPVAGKLYRFKTTPAGDTLSIEQYTGPAGTLRLVAKTGKGTPASGEVEITGPIGDLSVPIGEDILLPAGNYTCQHAFVGADSSHKFHVRPNVPIKIANGKLATCSLGGPITLELGLLSTAADAKKIDAPVAPGTVICPEVTFVMGGKPVDFPLGNVELRLVGPDGKLVGQTFRSNDCLSVLSIPQNAPSGTYRIEARYDTGAYQGEITTRTTIEVKQESQAGVSETDIEVFTTALSGWISGDKPVVVQRETGGAHVSEKDIESTADRAARSHKDLKMSKEEIKALLTALVKRNAAPADIPQIGPKERIIMVPGKEIKAIFDKGFWKEFYAVYPNAAGLVRLSLPAYSKDGRWAILYYSISSDGRAGSGWLQVYEKVDGKWRSASGVCLWVS